MYQEESYFSKQPNRYTWSGDYSADKTNDPFQRRPRSPDLFSKQNKWQSYEGTEGYSHYGQDRSRSPHSYTTPIKPPGFAVPSSYSSQSSKIIPRHDILDPWKLTDRDFSLPSKPTDLRRIMDMKWSPAQDMLVIPFQDGQLKAWKFNHRYGSQQIDPELVMNIKLKFPLVSMDFLDDGCAILYGDFQGNVLFFDIESEDVHYFGSHDHGVSSVHYYPSHSLAVTLGDDSTMKIYDSRQENPVFNHNMNLGMPVSSELKKDILIFATNTNQVTILNMDQLLRSGQKEYASFQGPLYHKVEHVALNSDQTQMAISGAQGRIAVRELNLRQPFNPKEMEKPTYNLQYNYTFKCHRDQSKDSRKDFIRSINQLEFHPRRNDVLATCGSDGSYFLWNIRYQSLILKGRPLPNPKTPVSNIAFNRDGSLFAYVVGDDGTMGMHPDWNWGFGYFVRVLLDTDLQVRQY